MDWQALLDSKLESCPTVPGCYLMKDEQGHVIYVGKAKNLRNRVRSYFQEAKDHSAKTQHLVGQVRDLEYLQTSNEVEALLLENNLIKKWKPKFNIRLRDDKTYPYIKLDLSHPYPRVWIARRQQKGDGNEYFGPFPNGMAARTTRELASKVFQLRDCRDHEFANRSRPCLSYQIGHCTAPCVNYVSKEEYAKQVEEYREFVKGKSSEWEAKWEAEMHQASERMDFEHAAKIRDRLNAVRIVVGQTQQMVDTLDLSDRDFWALWPASLQEAFESGDWGLDILILQFRGGKCVGRIYRNANIEEAIATEGLMANLLMQHYAKHPPPDTIVIPDSFEIPDRENFAQALRNQLKAPNDVSIHAVSEKGDWARVYELTLENVKAVHAENEARRHREDDGLEGIARLLDLERIPNHLECVDISNFQGEENVASAVVFKHGQPDKSQYRHYKIQGVQGQNDFASMREVMSRRFGKPGSPKPDLLVIDGGKGQLSSVLEILKGLGQSFPVVGLAKARTKRNFKGAEVESSEERLFLPNQKNYVRIQHAGALKILTRLRDEAHRFAIEFHRSRREKARLK